MKGYAKSYTDFYKRGSGETKSVSMPEARSPGKTVSFPEAGRGRNGWEVAVKFGPYGGSKADEEKELRKKAIQRRLKRLRKS